MSEPNPNAAFSSREREVGRCGVFDRAGRTCDRSADHTGAHRAGVAWFNAVSPAAVRPKRASPRCRYCGHRTRFGNLWCAACSDLALADELYIEDAAQALTFSPGVEESGDEADA